MRTATQERARYNGLTPQEFGDAIGRSAEFVREELIAKRWFIWTTDERGAAIPECQDVRGHGAARPEYAIHKSAVARWFRERAVVSGKAAA